MQRLLFLDCETFSATPISRGLDAYFRDPDAEMLMAQWAFGPRPVQLHNLTEDPIPPQELMDAINDPNVLIIAHKAEFERLAIQHLLGIQLPAERFFCTHACALAHSLPGGLSLLADVLRVTAKLEGKDHINLFCKPAPKKQKLRRATGETHPKEWGEFKQYAIGDVVTCREVYHVIPKRNYVGEHRRFWYMDQVVNDRGFGIDRELAVAAVELLTEDKAKQDSRVQQLTWNEDKQASELYSATQRDKLMLHLCSHYGVVMESMQADTLAAALDDDRLPEPVKELVRIRISTAMASTAKFNKLLQAASPDDRLRGTLTYCGASRTGRHSGKLFQPQNLRRPSMKQGEINYITDLIKLRDGATIEMLADLREACSNIMRGLIVAGPGKKLVVSDWSGIESRVLAWLAGEQWVLDVSTAADHDPKNNKDLYVHTVARAYGKALEEIDSYLRQQGKGMVLALGYEGGVPAFISIASAYGLDLDLLGRMAGDILPFEYMQRARDTWSWAVKKERTYGMAEHIYVACDAIKRSYRDANPNIRDQWGEYKNAFAIAVQYPGEKVETGKCLFLRRGNWLMIELPSGRTLMYPSPRVHGDGGLSYMGQVNKQWRRIKTYGGKIAENITQAVSNDVLRAALLSSADDEFECVLHVHDEIVCEQDEDDSYHTLARLDAHMRKELSWSKGLPLHTAGWEGPRYHK